MAQCLSQSVRCGPVTYRNPSTIPALEVRVRTQVAFAARRQAAGDPDSDHDRICDSSLPNIAPHDKHKRYSFDFFKKMKGKKKTKSGEEQRHAQRILPASGRTVFPRFSKSVRAPASEYHVWRGIRIPHWTPDPTYKSHIRGGRKRIKGKLVKLELRTIMEVESEE